MTKKQKILLILLIIGTLAFIKVAFFSTPEPVVQTEEPKTEQEIPQEEPNVNVPKSSIKIYFIGQNDNKDEVYKIVKRDYKTTDGTKLKAAITALLKGPDKKERAKGIYSEIPQGTKLLSIDESPNKIVINLSTDFEQGGGTDSLYKRLYQLIKTANKNSAQDVYLYINGKQIDVMGGEGLMINQPLNEKSLDE